MPLELFDTINVVTLKESIPVVLDFLIIACFIYGALYFLRGTRGSAVLAGIIFALVTAGYLSNQLHFEVLGKLIGSLGSIVATAIIVIFQPELRRAFAQLGTVTKAFSHQDNKKMKDTISYVVDACMQMSRSKTGALIVFEREIGMEAIRKSGVVLDATVHPLLLRALFFQNSPLHDGAVIIQGSKIVAAHVILPLSPDASESSDLVAKKLGTRHRAAMSITDEIDAVAVVVSEETGTISVAYKGNLSRDYDENTLSAKLNELIMQHRNLKMKLANMIQSSQNPENKPGQNHTDLDEENAFSDGTVPNEKES